MKKYILKVRYALSGLRVYEVETDNIYRIIGKMICTSMEHIERIDYSRFTLERLQYYIDEGFKINKYKEPVLSEDERANEREIKAEAYKELANRIKQVIVLNNTHDGYLVHDIDYNCLMEDIDDVLKELVGDNK